MSLEFVVSHRNPYDGVPMNVTWEIRTLRLSAPPPTARGCHETPGLILMASRDPRSWLNPRVSDQTSDPKVNRSVFDV